MPGLNALVGEGGKALGEALGGHGSDHSYADIPGLLHLALWEAGDVGEGGKEGWEFPGGAVKEGFKSSGDRSGGVGGEPTAGDVGHRVGAREGGEREGGFGIDPCGRGEEFAPGGREIGVSGFEIDRVGGKDVAHEGVAVGVEA